MGTDNSGRADDQLDLLDRAATRAVEAERWDEAERIWTQMRVVAPHNRNALFGLGSAALKRGDAINARTLLLTAQQAAPADVNVLLALATACRNCSDAQGEAGALSSILDIHPQHLPALLAMGTLLERAGHPEALTAHTRAVDAAPARPADWPQEFRAQLERAKAATDRHRQSRFNSLVEKLAQTGVDMPDDDRVRWREAASIHAKLTKPYHSECHQFFVPRLPAIPFYDRAQFPWVEALEAKTDLIRAELMGALETKRQDFVPYVTLEKSGAGEEWKHVNQSTRWSVFCIWKNGILDAENAAFCPETAKALAAVDQAYIRGNAPNAMFSALAPRTHIPPHSGESNARLVVHLPLITPEKCRLRVGYEEREWKRGEALIFDDSIEHEARNDSDELRVVLLFDIWNPHLTQRDREMVNTLVTG
ncbi:MAG: aspartyl/asparaginyl beta-hydroxylase domain-containing protein [Vitreimonas sp.]